MRGLNLQNDKFIPAKLPDVCAPRYQLLNSYHKAAGVRLIYVWAPAGYGKTVSTLLWLADSGRMPIWIGLDAYDNTLPIFYKLLGTGIASAQPDNIGMINTLRDPSFASSPVEHVISLLTEFTPDDTLQALVLDDFHLITNEEIMKSIPYIIKRLPHSFVTLILSRNEPSPEYMELVENGKAALIESRELAFSEEEIRGYFGDIGKFLTTKEAQAAHLLTGGWAIGVNALAMSGQIEFGQNGGHVFESYIKKQIWENWDKDFQDFMLKTAVVDEMTPDLANRLTGREDSEELLEDLRSKNSFVSRLGDGVYRYHHLFLDFLRSIYKKRSDIDANVLCDIAADWFYESGDYLKAVSYYITCGDQSGITKCLMQVNNYNYDNNVESEFTFAKTYVFDKLTDDFIEDNFMLVEMCAWISFLDGRAERFYYYLDILYNSIPAIMESTPDLIETISFLGGLDARTPLYIYSAELSKSLPSNALIAEAEAVSKKAKSNSITQNFPYMHRSMRDYSEFAIDTERRITDLRSAFLPLIGAEYNCIEDCIRAGLCYEMNKLELALEYALAAQEKCRPNFGVESKLCLHIILMTIYSAMQKTDEAMRICNSVIPMLETESALFLSHNFFASDIKIKLRDADKNTAAEWLEQYFVNVNSEHLEFYKIYQHFTTIRAYAVVGQTDKAMEFVVKVRQMATDYQRPLDIAEASALQAALEWATGRRKEAQITLESALTVMQNYGFIRVFADEGAAILPVLKKLISKNKKCSDTDPQFQRYLNDVYLAAYAHSKRFRGITANINETSVKLPKRQKQVITLLSEGFRNSQISEMTGLSINTVKAHTAAAYAKLNVNNASDAILRAKELGIIE